MSARERKKLLTELYRLIQRRDYMVLSASVRQQEDKRIDEIIEQLREANK